MERYQRTWRGLWCLCVRWVCISYNRLESINGITVEYRKLY